jgi:carbonic anhydrase/acetyltransferase-like protein (isoleucine patch superfamily)
VTSKQDEFKVFPDMVGRLERRGDAMIADNAVVVGDVRLGKDVGIWFGAMIRGDDARIEIGDGTNIQDNSVVHVDIGVPNRIGRNCTVGHAVILHGVEVGDHCLIGMGAVVLGGSRIGDYCIIGAGSVVPENMVVPDRSVVLGVPGKVRRQVTEEEMEAARWRATHYIERARSYLAPDAT